MKQVYSFPEGIIMSIWKKAVLFLLCATLMLPIGGSVAASPSSTVISLPNVSAQSAILLEAESSTVVYQKNAHRKNGLSRNSASRNWCASAARSVRSR